MVGRTRSRASRHHIVDHDDVRVFRAKRPDGPLKMDLIPALPRESLLLMTHNTCGKRLANRNIGQLMKSFAETESMVFTVGRNRNKNRIFPRPIGQHHPGRKLDPKFGLLMILKRFDQPLKRLGGSLPPREERAYAKDSFVSYRWLFKAEQPGSAILADHFAGWNFAD